MSLISFEQSKALRDWYIPTATPSHPNDPSTDHCSDLFCCLWRKMTDSNDLFCNCHWRTEGWLPNCLWNKLLPFFISLLWKYSTLKNNSIAFSHLIEKFRIYKCTKIVQLSTVTWPVSLHLPSQNSAGDSAVDITSGFRPIPFSPLPHSGTDQPTYTQVHELGHGSALTGHHQEAPGYDFLLTCLCILRTGIYGHIGN